MVHPCHARGVHTSLPWAVTARRVAWASKEEVLYVAPHRSQLTQDHVALVEIDLAGELMIAAATSPEDRLSPDRIDEVLDVDADRDVREAAAGAEQSSATARRL